MNGCNSAIPGIRKWRTMTIPKSCHGSRQGRACLLLAPDPDPFRALSKKVLRWGRCYSHLGTSSHGLGRRPTQRLSFCRPRNEAPSLLIPAFGCQMFHRAAATTGVRLTTRYFWRRIYGSSVIFTLSEITSVLHTTSISFVRLVASACVCVCVLYRFCHAV